MSAVRRVESAIGVFALLVCLATFANAQSPSISGISPASGVVGMVVEINGSGFGASQDISSVSLNGTNAVAISWSDTCIAAVVPTGAVSGPFSVTVGGQVASSSTFTIAALPSGWTDADVGSVGRAGSANYANGSFTVSGAGSQIYSTADSFHFVYQQLSGDGSIVARVASIQGVSGFYGAAAVVIRETLSTGATNATVADWATPGYFEFNYRTTTNGSATQNGIVTTGVPYWIKVVRSGNTFSAYEALDGVNWEQMGSTQTISMAQTVYMGLGVTSGSTSALATATFDNVSLSSSSSPAPAITGVSATTGGAGTQVTISGSGFGASQGSSGVMLKEHYCEALCDILENVREIRQGPLTFIEFRHGGWDTTLNLAYTSKYSPAAQEIHLYSVALRQADSLSEFLCYYRVIESATKSNGKSWIGSSLDALSMHNFGRITIGHNAVRRPRNLLSIWRSRALRRLSVLRHRLGSAAEVASYFYHVNRCGIAHGNTIVRADIAPSYFEVVRDTYVLKLLARLAIDQKV